MRAWAIAVWTAAVLSAAALPALAKETRSVTLDMPGITCAGCEAKIEWAVRTVPGVRTVRASAPSKVAVVIFDPEKADVERFIRATHQVGFLSSVAEGGYRCNLCGVSYPREGECVLCEGALEPA